ncbi:uroplakin-2 [Carassius auratus]|uniref:Uroplakin-2 n=1 Tax=Carassius auratus TaxID=7957 RepID=A0A6P6MP75_CARAU|nr:uroplakin-2-like [Carassius auratus]XP_052446135.1 uroplakin-2 [Carassius gibelio]
MLNLLFILGILCPLNLAEIEIRLLDPKIDGVLASRFPNSFLLGLPDCSVYGNKSAELLYTELPSNENKTKSFIVPSCSVTRLGLLLQNLKNGTTYNMQYKIAGSNDTSANLTMATTNVIDFQQIDSGLPARSGAMVVITVILSVAMAALLIGLIVVLFSS